MKKIVATLFDGKVVIEGHSGSKNYTAFVVKDGQHHYIGDTWVLHKFNNSFEEWVLTLKKKRMDKLPDSVEKHRKEYERLSAQLDIFKQLP